MACSVRETITRELRNNNFIDSKNNIIGDTSQVFPYIDSVNQFAKDNFGVTEDVLVTKSITNTAGARVKVRFNTNVVEQIDTNRENNILNSRYLDNNKFKIENEDILKLDQDYFNRMSEHRNLINKIDTIQNPNIPDLYHVYHGTNKLNIDKDNNLILKPSKNFSNKTESISFSQIPSVA